MSMLAMGGAYLGAAFAMAFATLSCASQSASKLLGQPVKAQVAVLVRPHLGRGSTS